MSFPGLFFFFFFKSTDTIHEGFSPSWPNHPIKPWLYVCRCIYMLICVWEHVHVCAQRLILGIFLDCPPFSLLRQDLFLSPEFTVLASLATQHALGIHPHLSFLSEGLQAGHHTILAFMCMVLHAYSASAGSTELPPQPRPHFHYQHMGSSRAINTGLEKRYKSNRPWQKVNFETLIDQETITLQWRFA